MAIKNINLYGDKILRKKSKDLIGVNNDIQSFIIDMFETMRNAEGIGLAANQVGSNNSIFIVDVSPLKGYEDSKPMVFINPKIVHKSDETNTMEEGCLSIPAVHEAVVRPASVTINFKDIDFNDQSLTAFDVLARVIQHEYDHLQGIFFTDLIDEEKQKLLKKQLQKIIKRKIDVHYPVTPKEN